MYEKGGGRYTFICVCCGGGKNGLSSLFRETLLFVRVSSSVRLKPINAIIAIIRAISGDEG